MTDETDIRWICAHTRIVRYMENGLKIIVAAHKPYDIPQDKVYLPVHAGAVSGVQTGYQSDAQGESISHKNPLYCELTALYWAWKNLPADALGLMHYRRYLGMPRRCLPGCAPKERIATGEELCALLEKSPIILPKKRNYYIENREDQYVNAHGCAGIDVLRCVMQERTPQYLPAFEASMSRTSGHCFNIFVMRRDICDAYCQWMFDTLFEVERVMRESMPQEIAPRLFGFISERMLDCWLETNGYTYIELPVVNMEKTNWLKKGGAFLKRKYIGHLRRKS